MLIHCSQIALAPPGIQACTVDIAKFHRTCPVSPDHKPWLVVQGRSGQFFIDHAHPFGASSASSNAGMIANAVVDIWRAEGVSPIFKYEDDLAIIRTPVANGSFLDSNGFRYEYDKGETIHRIASLCVPWHPDKGTPHFSSITTFIGLSWDLSHKTVSLPEHKRLKYLARVLSFLSQFSEHRCQLRDVEKIHGTLCYISFVYSDGRSHLPSLSNFASRFGGNIFMRLFPPRSLLTDLRWWSSRLRDPAFSRPLLPPGPFINKKIFVDASTSWGIGIVVDKFWMAFQLTEDWKRPGGDIGWLETIAVELIAYIIDAWDISNARILIHSDNQGTIGAMGKGRSPNYLINLAIRRAYSVFTPRSVTPSFSYIASEDNPADPLSRGILGPDELRLPIQFHLPKDLSAILVRR